MVAKLDDLLPELIDAGDNGLGKTAIKNRFAGKSKERQAELTEKLGALIRSGAIWGPVKRKGADVYFASGRGPSIETASGVINTLVQRSGVKLLSKAGLEKKVVGVNRRFFADGLKHAISSQRIVELSCGSSKYYLHREVATDYFGFTETGVAQEKATAAPVAAETHVVKPSLTLEDILPAYRRLKAENGGFSAVDIYDLLLALNVRKEELHRLLIEENKAGRVAIHHTTSLNVSREAVEAAIRLPGVAEPFITVVVKNES